MVRGYTLLLLIAFSTIVYSQSASQFFPADPGHKWYYEVTPLDSLNNPVTSLTSVRADSFVTQGTFYGEESNLVLSKFGSYSTINSNPWVDSTFVRLEGSVAYNFSAFVNYLSSGDSLFALWLANYNFAASLTQPYTIFQFDTTITYNDDDFLLRFKIWGNRLADEFLSTAIGDFTTKKFRITSGVYYVVQVLPGVFIEIPVSGVENDVWIAPDNWIVKEYQPSVVFDLSEYLPIPAFVIPGLQKNIITEPEYMLSLFSPDGGEVFYADYVSNIIWSSLEVENVNIYYSTNAGQEWNEIVSQYPADQQIYFWSVPSTLSDQCLVKIEDSDNTDMYDISSDVFSISAGSPQSWISSLQVYTTPDNKRIVGFGQDPAATDGIDLNLYEVPLESPPAGTLDARFVLPQGEESYIDYRFNELQEITWELKFQRANEDDPVTFSWQPLLLPEGNFILQDVMGGIYVNLNMKENNSVTLDATQINSLNIYYETPQENPVNFSVDAGWNIISVPFELQDMSVSSIFPEAISNAFAFENSYVQTEELSTGNGYWLKFDETYNYQFNGVTPSGSIELNEGWNIIGGFDSEIDVQQISTTPENIIESNFFGFNNGYTNSVNLLPGHGYWVKSNQAGVINVNNTSLVKKDESFNEIGTITITDANGYTSTLYVTETETLKNLLPPLPPDGVPDARFADDTYISLPGNTIKFSALRYPVSIKTSSTDLGLRVTGSDILQSDLILDGPVSNIIVESMTTPSEFRLEQNYPNPFNPATSISFSLPEPVKVKIEVYDILGNQVALLTDSFYEAGNFSIKFNATNLSSGVYIYTLSAGSYNSFKKMLLLK